MTDMDFDELDRAVNSIMAGGTRPAAPSRPASAAESSPAEHQTPPPAVDVVTPTPVTTAPPQDVITSESQSVSSAPAPNRAKSAVTIPTRRSGRFMDVVHPSAGMRAPSGVATKTVSRNAGVVEPIEVAVNRPKPNLDELNDLLNSSATDSAPSTFDESIVSPFIADAKVDKRPLGNALSSDGETTDPNEESRDEVMDSFSDTDEQVAPEVQAPSEDERRAAMPAELNPDVLSIETALENDASAESPSQSVPVSRPAPAPVQAQTPPRPQTDRPKSTAPSTAPVSAGSIAIQQQYASAPAVEHDEIGSIYDTDTYHQPLMHPEQNKAGWSWVVWVVGLLILGAGGGALAYYLLIQ